MSRRHPGALVSVGLALALAATPAAAEPLTAERMRRFLESAEIVAWTPIGSGSTGAWRLTLDDGTLTHDAAFQAVDFTTERAGAAPVVDSFHHNIAAYRLAELIGLSDMLPVTVARTWRDTPGALSWWIDDVILDEDTRLDAGRWPPDLDAWGAAMDRMWLFAELVHDTDRHGGNLLYTSDWSLYLVDFTRAFQPRDVLLKSYRLAHVDPAVLARLETLTDATVADVTAPHLTPAQVAAVLARRDRIVAHLRSPAR